jgi:molybdopterin-containing oxidoreductase family membrane subunit
VRGADLIAPPTDDATLTDELVAHVFTPRPGAFRFAIAAAVAGTFVLFAAITATVTTGIGLWGNNIPVGWAFGIINFVWWIGIGYAGTFISAILLLLEQRWRTSINRFAEAMTLFAVMQAGLYPLLHLGRPWFAYWLIPYPATMQIWPQWKSALPWDAAAIATYFTVSLLFFYVGLLPDLAAVRDRATSRGRRVFYGVLALGWRGSAEHLRHYRVVYGLLAGLSTPLVVSVHSIVSSDFAITLLPGWHSTIFPPFFVAGAILSGFGMVLTLIIPARRAFRMERVITERHLDNLAKLTLVTAWVVTYSYVVELFIAWYGGDPFEGYQFFVERSHGPGAFVTAAMFTCNAIVPQVLWSRRMRRNEAVLFVVSILVNVGMWAERFVIIVHGLQRDFLPSSFGAYRPTLTDLSLFGGTLAFFGLLFLGFLRFFPFVPLAEVKELGAELAHEEEHG